MSISPIFFYLGLFGLAVPFLVAVVLKIRHTSFWTSSFVFLTFVFVFIAGTFLATCTSPPGSTLVMDSKGKVITHIPADKFYINSRLAFVDIRTCNPDAAMPFQAGNQLSLVVNDPVIRTIHYTIKTEVIRTEHGLATATANFGWVDRRVSEDFTMKPEAFIESLTYDFNQHHGDELKSFFNPKDDAQQAAFLALMHHYLDQSLNDRGLVLKSANFTIQ